MATTAGSPATLLSPFQPPAPGCWPRAAAASLPVLIWGAVAGLDGWSAVRAAEPQPQAELQVQTEPQAQTELQSQAEPEPIVKPAGVEAITLEPGFSLDHALRHPGWFSLSVSALNQTNGTIGGLSPARATPSNLFGLAMQLGPFTRRSEPTSSGAIPAATQTQRHHEQTSGSGSGAGETGTDPAALWRKLALNVLLTQRTGAILSARIPNILNTQWNYGNAPIARLNILSLQYQNPEGLLSSLKVGKLMQAQDFTLNPIQCYFANFGFCGWAQGTPSMVPIPGNPFNSYGAVIQLGKRDHATLKYGAYQLAPSTFAPQYHGLNFRLDQGIGTAHFLEASLPIATPRMLPVRRDPSRQTLRPAPHGDSNALYHTQLPPGVLTLGGWLARGSFAAVGEQAGLGAASAETQNNGLYAITSVRLPLDGIALDNRLFLSAGAGLSAAVQDFTSGGSAGLVLAGVLASRPYDTLSLGASYASYNSQYYLSPDSAGTFTPGTEVALEMNYNIAINKALSIMPNLQLILAPAGDGGRPAVVVAGLQLWLNF